MISSKPIEQKTQSLKIAVCRALGKTPLSPLVFSFLGRLKARRCGIRGVDFVRASIKAQSGAILEAIEMVKEELRLFPDNAEASELLKQLEVRTNVSVTQCDQKFNEEFRSLYAKIKPYTMVSADRLFALYRGAMDICSENLEGNFAECGVAGGGSSALLAYVLKRYSKVKRSLFAFDTFEGLPGPGQEDVRRGVSAAQAGWGEGTCAAPVDCLRRIAEELDVWDHIVPVQGLFQDTLAPARSRISRIALLHMDGDWYDSTKTILSNFYDLVVPGGYVQVDDYGYWEGCRKAVDEFEAVEGVHLTKQPIDSSGICFRKPH
jgi:hypothetical protein